LYECAAGVDNLFTRDRNWLEFISVLDATFACLVSPTAEPHQKSSDEVKAECCKYIHKAHGIFSRVAEEDGSRDRSGLLALLDLEHRSRMHGISSGMSSLVLSKISLTNGLRLDQNKMVDLMQNYFREIGHKPCCFEDLKPYIQLHSDDLTRWTMFLNSIDLSFASICHIIYT
jgi:N-terminal acetyltransferase B complex non-catalytic subunit